MKSYSVLMSVYAKEQAEFLRDSIESMLNQTVMPEDFVLVCDGALTEELEKVISDADQNYPGLFQIIRLEENQGLGKALSKGLKFCKNELIARMDSDDISDKHRCQKQLKVFEQQKVDIVGGNIKEFTEDISTPTAERCVPQTHEKIVEFARRRNPFNHPTVMFRKSSVEKAGGYLDCPYFEDYYLWTRMLQQGMIGYNIQDILVFMRTSAGMYKRRGSVSYAMLGLKARYKIYKTGFSGIGDFLVSGGGQIVMAVIPVSVRKFFYGKFLRN